MLSFYVHLLGKAFFAIPVSLGGNWLGLIFPLAPVVCAVIVACSVRGWRAAWRVVIDYRKQFSGSLLASYILLFGWCVLAVNYQDHQALASALDSLKKPAPRLTARVIDSEFGANGQGFFLGVLGLNLENAIGPERPITDWQLRLITDSKEIEPFPFFMPAETWKINSKDGKSHLTYLASNYCPQQNQSPLPSGTQRTCWMAKYFKIKTKDLDLVKATLVIQFTDVQSGEAFRFDVPLDSGTHIPL